MLPLSTSHHVCILGPTIRLVTPSCSTPISHSLFSSKSYKQQASLPLTNSSPPKGFASPQLNKLQAPTGYHILSLIAITYLGLAKAVVPMLGLHWPLATGILFLARLTPILMWSLLENFAHWSSVRVSYLDTWGHVSYFLSIVYFLHLPCLVVLLPVW